MDNDKLQPSRSAYIYDSRFRAWASLQPMTTPRTNTPAIAHSNGVVYVAGGNDGKEVLHSAESYHIDAQEWKALPRMLTRRMNTSGVFLSNGVHFVVTGGRDANFSHKSCEMFDTLEHTWERFPVLEQNRCDHACLLYMDRVVVLGGMMVKLRETTALATCETYNPEATAWKPFPPLITARRSFGACALDNQVFVVGGCSSNEAVINTKEVFDGTRWVEVRSVVSAPSARLPIFIPCSLLQLGRSMVKLDMRGFLTEPMFLGHSCEEKEICLRISREDLSACTLVADEASGCLCVANAPPTSRLRVNDMILAIDNDSSFARKTVEEVHAFLAKEKHDGSLLLIQVKRIVSFREEQRDADPIRGEHYPSPLEDMNEGISMMELTVQRKNGSLGFSIAVSSDFFAGGRNREEKINKDGAKGEAEDDDADERQCFVVSLQRDDTGLLIGDVLMAANGIVIEGRTQADVAKVLRGAGEKVSLMVLRGLFGGGHDNQDESRSPDHNESDKNQHYHYPHHHRANNPRNRLGHRAFKARARAAVLHRPSPAAEHDIHSHDHPEPIPSSQKSSQLSLLLPDNSLPRDNENNNNNKNHNNNNNKNNSIATRRNIKEEEEEEEISPQHQRDPHRFIAFEGDMPADASWNFVAVSF